MTTIQRLLLGLAIAAATSLPLHAYNHTITHREMTIVATQKSVLHTDGSILYALGLHPVDTYQFLYTSRLDFFAPIPDFYTVTDLVALGAIEEDLGERPARHFFDPYHHRGMLAFANSWEWSLEETPMPAQGRSLADAREYLTTAMTYNAGTPAESETERVDAAANMLLSLGHVLHHLQDMAQPQHVRHDAHVDVIPIAPWPIYNPSRYEYYTADHNDVVAAQARTATPVFPGSSDFKTARDFWFNAVGTGIAETVNREFISQSTNFTATETNVTTGVFPFPRPGAATDYAIEELYAESGMPVPLEIQLLCRDVICKMKMYSTPVSGRASTLSIFDQDLRTRWPISRFFDLNRFNFDDAHKELIKRGVAFSAGFVNHFFRGKLQVSAPATGSYAVVDHSAGKGIAVLRTVITNRTDGEELAGGGIVAIATFHRNGCYRADLTGEMQFVEGQVVIPCPEIRSSVKHLRVSGEPLPVSFAVGESQEMTFVFPDPIPLDATDLVLRVYYTGTVGAEAESFALGAVDVAEPTYLTVMNATDVFGLSGAFYYWQDIIDNIAVPPYSAADVDGSRTYGPPDPPVEGHNMAFEIFLNEQYVGTTVLPQGRFARIAAIVDPQAPVRLRLMTAGQTMSLMFSPRLFQHYGDQGWRITLAEPLRNQTLQYASTTLFRYYPSLPASIDGMPPSRAAAAAVPVPVDMTPPIIIGALAAPEWTRSMDVFRAMRAKALAPMAPMPPPNLAAHPRRPVESRRPPLPAPGVSPP